MSGVAAVLATALVLAGCGSSGPSVQTYATNTCGAFTTWLGTVKAELTAAQTFGAKAGITPKQRITFLEGYLRTDAKATEAAVQKFKSDGVPSLLGAQNYTNGLISAFDQLDAKIVALEKPIAALPTASTTAFTSAFTTKIQPGINSLQTKLTAAANSIAKTKVDQKLINTFKSTASCKALQTSTASS